MPGTLSHEIPKRLNPNLRTLSPNLKISEPETLRKVQSFEPGAVLEQQKPLSPKPPKPPSRRPQTPKMGVSET